MTKVKQTDYMKLKTRNGPPRCKQRDCHTTRSPKLPIYNQVSDANQDYNRKLGLTYGYRFQIEQDWKH